ncbi:MAG: hypothetical protein GY811_21795 [Myxococcales bacterium]|nr:hypothetical protein [Myxococcales bacterium]
MSLKTGKRESWLLLAVVAALGAAGCARAELGASGADAGAPGSRSDARPVKDDLGSPDAGEAEIGLRGIALGSRHTCSVYYSGDVRCWGNGEHGRLGSGAVVSLGESEVPSALDFVDLGGRAVQVVAGAWHSCALIEDGAVRCWGDSSFGQLGYGNTETIGDNETPASAGNVDIGGKATKLFAGSWHTCALLESGGLKCWGAGRDGRLGYGNEFNIGDNESPSAVGEVAVGGVIADVVLGAFHSCALIEGGTMRCWGSNAEGQLGLGTTNDVGDSALPSSVAPIEVGGTVIAMGAGRTHTCAVLETNELRCWGEGLYGRLGYGSEESTGDTAVPSALPTVDVGHPVSSVALGGFNTCALSPQGQVSCWGLASLGRLGYGNTDRIGDDETPSTAGTVDIGEAVSRILTADHGDHTCAVLEDRRVRCWGFNLHGVLGYGHTNDIGDDEAPATAGDVSIN